MTQGNLISLFIGMVLGIIICFIIQRLAFRMAVSEIKEIERSTERSRQESDPANWWRYGRDPFEDSVYDRDEENGMA